jgi:hypothetical protein
MDGCEYLDLTQWHTSDLSALVKAAPTSWHPPVIDVGAFKEEREGGSQSTSSHWPSAVELDKHIRVFQRSADGVRGINPLFDVASAASVMGVVVAAILASAGFQFAAFVVLGICVLMGAAAYVAKSRTTQS